MINGRNDLTVAAGAVITCLLGLCLTGCGGGSSAGAAGTSPSPTSGSASASSPPSPTASTSGSFKAAATALCNRFAPKVKALGTPSSPSDVPAFARKAIPLEKQYLQQFTVLVNRYPAAAPLRSSYLKLERTDFDAQAPLIRKLAKAVEAKDSTAEQKLATRLQHAPDHTTQEAAALSHAGIPVCAKLEVSG